MESLKSPPETSSFVLLADHQARTPVSFHDGPPVLHYHSKRCKLTILERDLRSIPALSAISPTETGANGNATENAEEDKEVVVDGVDVWVTSDKFLLYSPTTSTGVSIPYPSISLHAIQRLRLPNSPANSPEVQGLYMQIATPSASAATQAEEEEEPCITMTVVPPPEPTPEQEQEDKPDEQQTPTQMLYGAVSACSNLHPDPGLDEEDDENDGSDAFGSGLVMPGDGQGGLPPPVDGSSGWITAENMHEFFDEEGNWIAGGEEPTLPLGPGAGTVREREGEGDGEGQNGGENEGNEEAKWRRTD